MKNKIPRQYSFVQSTGIVFDGFKGGIFLGEIPNMPGHCIVYDTLSKQMMIGYHTENFEEIPEDEV